MFWDYKILKKIDLSQLGVIIILMIMSLLVISSTTSLDNPLFLTPYVKSQIKWFFLGTIVYSFFAGLDYRFLKKVSPFLYLMMLFLLFGLFFTGPIQNVQRWYKIPILNFMFQPSEYAKLIVVIALGSYLADHLDDIKKIGAY